MKMDDIGGTTILGNPQMIKISVYPEFCRSNLELKGEEQVKPRIFESLKLNLSKAEGNMCDAPKDLMMTHRYEKLARFAQFLTIG